MPLKEVPRVAYGIGTAWSSKGGSSDVDRSLVDAIKTALKLGYRHIDNAEVYGNESACGVALTESDVPRDSLWITTKVWNLADPVSVLKSSLSKLKLDYVDLYLIHRPFPLEGDGEMERCWKAMEECRSAGMARHIGVSNFRVGDLDRLRKVATSPIFANQVEMHPYNAQPELHAYMRSASIEAMSYSPLAAIVHKPGGPLDGVVGALTDKYGRTTSQILLRWNLQKGCIVVTTSSKEDRMRDQLAITDFELTADEVGQIDEAGAKLSFRKYFADELGGNE